MYDGAVNRRSGIVVVLLPSVNNGYIHTAHGAAEKRLYSNVKWGPMSSKNEFKNQHPYMPDRLVDNITKDDVKISVVPWNSITPQILGSLVDMAFEDKEDCKYDLSQPMRRKNS